MAVAVLVPTLYKYTLARPRTMSGDATCVNEMAGCWQLASFYILGPAHIPFHGHSTVQRWATRRTAWPECQDGCRMTDAPSFA